MEPTTPWFSKHVFIEKPDRPLYAYTPQYFTNEARFSNKILKLHHPLHGINDFAKVWYGTVCDLFRSLWLKEMESSICVFHKADIFTYWRVENLLVFFRHGRDIMKFERNSDKNFVTKKRGHPTHFIGFEMKCADCQMVARKRSLLVRRMFATHGVKNSAKAKCPITPRRMMIMIHSS